MVLGDQFRNREASETDEGEGEEDTRDGNTDLTNVAFFAYTHGSFAVISILIYRLLDFCQ